MAEINWTKVREAVRALASLTADETEAAFNLLASVNEARDAAKSAVAAPTPKPKPKRRKKPGPKPVPVEGGIACHLCGDRFRTSHGLKIHLGRAHKTGELFPKEVKNG